MVAESFNLPKTVVLRILKEILGKRMLCARFFPTILDTRVKGNRVTSCQDIITMADADKNILNKIITGDGTWRFAHDRETKQQRKVVKI